jgi:hypothetical protein
VFDGISGELGGATEILVRDGRIAEMGPSVSRPDGAELVDLSDRTVSPGFIDTHVHLTMDAGALALQTLGSTATKALTGLSLAQEYLGHGFTTLRDLGSVDPEFPTVDLRNAIDRGLVPGPRLVVAAHIISSTGGHGDLSGFYPSRWDLPVSAVGDSIGEIRRLVRREHATARTGSRPSTPVATSAWGTTLLASPGSTKSWTPCARRLRSSGCRWPCTPARRRRASRRSGRVRAASSTPT